LNLFPGRVFVVLLTLSQLDSNSESHAYAPAGVYDLRAFGFFFVPVYFLDILPGMFKLQMILTKFQE